MDTPDHEPERTTSPLYDHLLAIWSSEDGFISRFRFRKSWTFEELLELKSRCSRVESLRAEFGQLGEHERENGRQCLKSAGEVLFANVEHLPERDRLRFEEIRAELQSEIDRLLQSR